MRLFIGIIFLSIFLNAHINEAVLYSFEKKCMICHNTYKKNKIAPPLVAVNQVYLRLYDENMSLAMNKMKIFLANPTEKKVLLKPAFKLFGLMPKLDLNATEVNDFSQVLIETEFEIPDWFNAHYKSHDLNKS